MRFPLLVMRFHEICKQTVEQFSKQIVSIENHIRNVVLGTEKGEEWQATKTCTRRCAIHYMAQGRTRN